MAEKLMSFMPIQEAWITKLKQVNVTPPQVIGVISTLLVIHLVYKYTFFLRQGLRGPMPVPFLGNFLNILFRSRHLLELEWPRKYGKLYGTFTGTQPVLVCADPAVIRQICIKDFSSFPNHMLFPVKNKYQDTMIIFRKDDDWRSLRAILSPTFSTGKLKQIHEQLVTTSSDFQKCIERIINQDSGLFECRELMNTVSMSSAQKSFLGVVLPAGKIAPELGASAQQSSQHRSPTLDEFVRIARAFFSTDNFMRLFSILILPVWFNKFFKIYINSTKPFEFFFEFAHSVVKQRVQTNTNGHRRNDYLQLLVDARAMSSKNQATGSDHLTDVHSKEEHHALDIDHQYGLRPSTKRLDDFEMHCQVMMLVLVATETTGSLMSNVLYALAAHPDIQRKLHAELAPIRDTLDYEKLATCEYLDCVISEGLRAASPVLNMDRVAREDYHLTVNDYNILIPKGTVVNLAIFAMHNDHEFWPEPEKFKPERFSAENKHKIVPGSYLPFGVGPRACVGFRFALAEAKLMVARMVCAFEFELADERSRTHGWPPEFMETTGILTPRAPFKLRAQKRIY